LSGEVAAAVLPWTARRLFSELRELGPLRVISQSGPSVFETLCRVDGFGVADGWLNAITPDYHWHLRLDGFGHLATFDRVHGRSGRRVLGFALAAAAGAAPFLEIYLHRGRDEEFGTEREARFAALHRELGAGREVTAPPAEATDAG
jgi:putative heme iron utilization protein